MYVGGEKTQGTKTFRIDGEIYWRRRLSVAFTVYGLRAGRCDKLLLLPVD
jgi:hypothetical protein